MKNAAEKSAAFFFARKENRDASDQAQDVPAATGGERGAKVHAFTTRIRLASAVYGASSSPVWIPGFFWRVAAIPNQKIRNRRTPQPSAMD